MAQIRVYGNREHLTAQRQGMSDAIHACMIEALELPPEKRFHRFLALEREDFIYPDDRTERYTIIEISMFAGRSRETKKRLIRLLFSRLEAACGIAPNDIEITIFETPREHWGIRGLPGDEVGLPYTVAV